MAKNRGVWQTPDPYPTPNVTLLLKIWLLLSSVARCRVAIDSHGRRRNHELRNPQIFGEIWNKIKWRFLDFSNCVKSWSQCLIYYLILHFSIRAPCRLEWWSNWIEKENVYSFGSACTKPIIIKISTKCFENFYIRLLLVLVRKLLFWMCIVSGKNLHYCCGQRGLRSELRCSPLPKLLSRHA